VLAGVLLASALKLLGAASVTTAAAAAGVTVVLLFLPSAAKRLGAPYPGPRRAERETARRAHLSEV
jgi:hypothetical protein